jgi:hypothetical protein
MVMNQLYVQGRRPTILDLEMGKIASIFCLGGFGPALGDTSRRRGRRRYRCIILCWLGGFNVFAHNHSQAFMQPAIFLGVFLWHRILGGTAALGGAY